MFVFPNKHQAWNKEPPMHVVICKETMCVNVTTMILLWKTCTDTPVYNMANFSKILIRDTTKIILQGWDILDDLLIKLMISDFSLWFGPCCAYHVILNQIIIGPKYIINMSFLKFVTPMESIWQVFSSTIRCTNICHTSVSYTWTYQWASTRLQ